jgi:hypothetical protein
MASNQPQVFVSYQRTDELFARRVREHLAAAGVRTWMDQYDIPVGAYWPDEIDRGLAASDIVVGILSPDAVASRNVKNEWDWALARDKPLLLLMTRWTEIPHRYVSINYIDATTDQRRALDALLQHLIESHTDAPQPAPVRHGSRRATRRYPTVPELVGREQEQELLRRQVERLVGGQGGLLLIGGEAGIGKTTLARWLGWLAEERGVVVLTGGCYDLTTTPPYGPWVEIFRAWPDGGQLPPVPDALRGGESLARVGSQAALFEQVADFLAEVGAARPLVLLLEDLHWIDQASLDLLRYLTRQLVTQPILLVATYRSDELHRRHPLHAAIPALLRDTDGRRLELRQLDDDAVLALVYERYLLADDDTRRLAAYIQRRAEGHALYVRELLLTVEEAGLLTRAGDSWALGDLSQSGVPTLIRHVIEERLARLGSEPHAALMIAAVIGHEAPLDVWAEVGERTEDALLDVIDRAVEARILTASPDGLSVSFTHALIREALYEGITPPRRRVWHRRVGEALLARLRPDPDALAWHFGQASDPRATDWLIQAGERAQRAAAWTIAAERSIAALPGLEADAGRDAERARLLYRIGRLLRYQDTPQSQRYLEDARELARAVGDRKLAAHARFALGQTATFVPRLTGGATDPGRALAEMEAAVADWNAAAGVAPDADGEVNPDVGALVHYFALYGRAADAVVHAEAFLHGSNRDAVEEDMLASPVTDALFGLGLGYAALGRPDEAEVALRRAQERYDRLGNMIRSYASRATALGLLMLPYYADRIDERTRLEADARKWLERAWAAGQGTGHPWTLLGEPLWLTGHWDHPNLELYTSGVIGNVVPPATVRRAWHRGDEDGAWSLVRAVFPDGPATDPGAIYGFSWLLIMPFAAEMSMEAGDREAADAWVSLVEAVLGRWGGVLFQAEGQLLRARYQHLSGDRYAARMTAEAALVRATDPRQPYALLQVHRFLGQLATEDGRFEDAARDLAQSLALALACEFPFERALTLLEQAELHRARGDHAVVHDTLAAVRAICEPLRAKRVLDRVAEMEARMAPG